MKCPRPQCGNEVAKLIQHPATAAKYPQGLCSTCDAIERAGTADDTTWHAAYIETPPRRGPGRRIKRREPDDLSQPRQKRKYTRRTPAAKAPNDELSILEKLRQEYQAALDAAQATVDAMVTKLYVLDELEARLKP